MRRIRSCTALSLYESYENDGSFRRGSEQHFRFAENLSGPVFYQIVIAEVLVVVHKPRRLARCYSDIHGFGEV